MQSAMLDLNITSIMFSHEGYFPTSLWKELLDAHDTRNSLHLLRRNWEPPTNGYMPTIFWLSSLCPHHVMIRLPSWWI